MLCRRRPIFSSRLFLALGLLLAAGFAPCGFSQEAPAPATAPGEPRVTMDFPADGVELSVLADIVTQRLHVPILYDDQIRNKKVVIRVPVKVPESALMGILQSALRMKQMALVDAEAPGWKQIVPAPSLAAVARTAPGVAAPAAAALGPIAQVFVLSHADATHLADVIRPFLTQPNGYLQADPAKRVLIVSDYPATVARVADLIKLLDADAPPVVVQFVPLHQAEATLLVPALSQLISSRESAQWGSGAASGIFLSADERSNQIVVVAPPARLKEVTDLIAGMDHVADLKTKVYRFKAVTPDRVDKIIRGLIGPALVKRGYMSVVDADSQTLAVSATPDVLSRLDSLVQELDVPIADAQSPIRFYKLKNTKAADVLSTIGGLLGQDDTGGTNRGRDAQGAGGEGPAADTTAAGGSPAASPSANPPPARTPFNAGGTSSLSPASPPVGTSSATGSPAGLGAGGGPGVSVGNSADVRYVSPAVPYTNASGGSTASAAGSVHARNATVAADANSNSIIVIAPPQVQQTYADLIKRLDERRPQVQIECTIVTLDTSDGFSFGVDISKLGASGPNKLLTLSSFGISTADATTGRLTPGATTGGTFALLSPRIADIVISALATNSRSRFLSAPRLLVNDNGKGKLESVQQQPFAVILDASSTQSLTSLGGQAQAGTSISVEPHISEGDYLQLAYSIELSNFTGAASNGLPPPSDKNSVDSSVTIPDGYTIVVGGLTTKSLTTSVNTIPLVGDIPLLKYLFGTRTRNLNDSTLFVFIKPVILRDDKFEDLKFLSGLSATEAAIPADYPQGEPVPMK